MKTSILTAILLAVASPSIKAQSLPPDTYFTNTLSLWLVCSNYGWPTPLMGTNFIGSIDFVGTNAPPDFCYNAGWVPFDCGYPQQWLRYTVTKPSGIGTFSNQVSVTGTDGIRLCYTNFIAGTNTVTRWLSYHTDGDTLSFAHNLTGPWLWSGSRNYRQPTYNLIYEKVRGVSTDGSVNPVHLWATNEEWLNGVLIKSEVITQ